MFDPLARIQRSVFPPISIFSKSEWNSLGNYTAYDLKVSSTGVIYVEDKDGIPYSHQYLVATSTNIRA